MKEQAMIDLWTQYSQWQTQCRWVDLSRELSEDTPHWHGFPAMTADTMFTTEKDGFYVHQYTLVSQYGTHVDAPIHFIPGMRTVADIAVDEMVLPLCVIDLSAKVAENPDYAVTADDIRQWESVYGAIPEKAFAAFRSDWSKRKDDELDNIDADGQRHYPGWGVDALQYLVQERHVAAIGHETSDTDAAVLSAAEGFRSEPYILGQNCYQIELMTNLDLCPPTGAIIFCTFPKVKNGTGFTSRCFALCPKEGGE